MISDGRFDVKATKMIRSRIRGGMFMAGKGKGAPPLRKKKNREKRGGIEKERRRCRENKGRSKSHKGPNQIKKPKEFRPENNDNQMCT